MHKYFIFILFLLLLVSCGKEKSPVTKHEKQVDQQLQEEDTTTLSPEEAFSSALVDDILNVDDEDLQVYLEEEFYSVIKKSDKVSIDKISSSLYLLTYFENGTEKNYLIQKSYNPANDEIIFDKKETQTNAVKQFIK